MPEPSFTWSADSGLGTVWSYCVYHRAFDAAFRPAVPYNVALVELDSRAADDQQRARRRARRASRSGSGSSAAATEVAPGRSLVYFRPATAWRDNERRIATSPGLVVRTAHAVTVDGPAAASRCTDRSSRSSTSLACCVAGSRTQGSVAVADWAQATGPASDSVIIGTALRTTPPMAALANGAAGHALDYDDVSMRMIHPSVNLVPALLAAGEPRHVSGRALPRRATWRASRCRRGSAGRSTPSTTTGAGTAPGRSARSARPWPPPACTGSTRSTAGGRSGSPPRRRRRIRKNFGSMVKPLHPGQAAFHGLQAADLAARGFTGDRSVLEGKNGFLAALLQPRPPPGDSTTAFADGAPYELVESGIALKRFACCGAIHSAQDALLDLLETDAFTPRSGHPH